MTVREQQIADALATRERQVERAVAVEEVVRAWNAGEMPGHHGYAVCVKEHTLGGDRVRYGTDDYEADLARYDRARESWWEDVQEIGREHGFERVYSAGRSSGYAVPHPQPNTDDMYDEDVEAWLRESFAPFVLDVRALMREHVERWNTGEWDEWDADEEW
jgi:hypothetical protein